jgi:hypothetical protein
VSLPFFSPPVVSALRLSSLSLALSCSSSLSLFYFAASFPAFIVCTPHHPTRTRKIVSIQRALTLARSRSPQLARLQKAEGLQLLLNTRQAEAAAQHLQMDESSPRLQLLRSRPVQDSILPCDDVNHSTNCVVYLVMLRYALRSSVRAVTYSLVLTCLASADVAPLLVACCCRSCSPSVCALSRLKRPPPRSCSLTASLWSPRAKSFSMCTIRCVSPSAFRPCIGPTACAAADYTVCCFKCC